MSAEDIIVVCGTAVMFIICVVCLVAIRRALKRPT